VVLNRWFLGAFLGSGLLCLLLLLLAFARWEQPVATWLLSAGLCYLVGAVLVTLVCNVPRNDKLAKVEAASAAGADLWARYLVGWTLWNTLRTLAALAASGLFIVALTRL